MIEKSQDWACKASQFHKAKNLFGSHAIVCKVGRESLWASDTNKRTRVYAGLWHDYPVLVYRRSSGISKSNYLARLTQGPWRWSKTGRKPRERTCSLGRRWRKGNACQVTADWVTGNMKASPFVIVIHSPSLSWHIHPPTSGLVKNFPAMNLKTLVRVILWHLTIQ